MTSALIFTEPPKDFSPSLGVAGCFCECEDRILLLKRHPDKPQGNTWGLPAGKLEKGESPESAAIREVFEEVGLKTEVIKKVGRLYVRLPHIDFIFHMFRQRFNSYPPLQLALAEHVEARWVTIDEALQLPLIIGGKEALDYYKEFILKPS